MGKFLVTGGAGFIGSNLCERLLKDGHSVKVFDNLSTGKKEHMKGFLDSVEFIKGDVRDFHAVEKAVDEVEFVIHLAALGSVPLSIEAPKTTYGINVNGTHNILMAARAAGVKRVVYASSSAVYGEAPDLPKKEDMMPMPMSPYAVSKLIGERLCKVFNNAYGLETVSLRYFNVFGKRQDPCSQYAAVIPGFITSLVKKERPCIYGDGLQTRDFISVEDCVQANIKACFAENCAGEVFNVGSGTSTSVNELFRIIRDSLEADTEPVYGPERAGDIRDSVADIKNAINLLGYAPSSDLEAAIGGTVRWYAEEGLMN